MTRQELFNALWQIVKDTDVDFKELLDDDGEGGIYIVFSNVKSEG